MNEREIFDAARPLTDPAERASFLAQACNGNTTLRGRVERLLLVDSQRNELLDVPALPGFDLEGLANTPHFGAGPTIDLFTEKTFQPYLSLSDRPDSGGGLGHYELFECLGNGGFGAVFRAYDDVLRRDVAIKIMFPHLATSASSRRRFLREARSVAAINHENVVRVHAIEETPLPHLVMEFVQGETLQRRLDRAGALDVAEVIRIGRQLAAGLAAAHAAGVVHRDIKPANVLIDSGPSQLIKLTDFGLARAVDDAGVSQSVLIAGTPMFMSPEQARGDTVDHRSDLFSVGSVLYAMTTGRPPFRAEKTLAMLRCVCDEAPRPIREFAPETPQWLVDVISQLHAKRPEERIQSALELVDRLEQCESIPLAPNRRGRWKRYRKHIVATAVLTVVMSLVGALAASDAVARRFRSNDVALARSSTESAPTAIDTTFEADRRAAEWVISMGEPHFRILVDDRIMLIDAGRELPQTPFQVREVNLNRHSRVTDDGLAVFQGLRSLTWLQLTNVNITDAALVHLKDCKNLEHLLLYSTHITDRGLQLLEGLTKLEHLSVKSTHVSEEGVRNFAKAMPQCQIHWDRGVIWQTALPRH